MKISITNIFYIFLFSIIFSGCSQKTFKQIAIEKSKEKSINYKTILAICKAESNLNPNVINVNKSIFNIQKGPHYFNSSFAANLYMDTILDPLFLNYDIGLCQINKQHLDRFDLDNEDLLEPETNVETAVKIYSYNVKQCKGDIYCSLSMYNTGRKKSKIGFKYAEKVLKIRERINY